jgi:hypothetical protein
LIGPSYSTLQIVEVQLCISQQDNIIDRSILFYTSDRWSPTLYLPTNRPFVLIRLPLHSETSSASY